MEARRIGPTILSPTTAVDDHRQFLEDARSQRFINEAASSPDHRTGEKLLLSREETET